VDTPASAPVAAPEVPQEFDQAWWNGLGLPWAGDGLWAPDAKATLIVNAQKAKCRGADDPVAWINARWREWYPALDRAKSRTEFHALWLAIRWSCQEVHRLTTEVTP
jgi:hypothetical protein